MLTVAQEKIVEETLFPGVGGFYLSRAVMYLERERFEELLSIIVECLDPKMAAKITIAGLLVDFEAFFSQIDHFFSRESDSPINQAGLIGLIIGIFEGGVEFHANFPSWGSSNDRFEKSIITTIDKILSSTQPFMENLGEAALNKEQESNLDAAIKQWVKMDLDRSRKIRNALGITETTLNKLRINRFGEKVLGSMSFGIISGMDKVTLFQHVSP